MKRKSYILKIENPCSQDWTLMTANEAGRFCSHCSKTIVDFTNLSDQQIIEYITLNSGKLCGRLTSQQNNRTFVSSEQRGKNLTFYKFISGLLLFGTTQNSSATNEITPTEIIESIDRKEILSEDNKNELTDSLKNVVQGKVIDAQTKEIIPFGYVGIKNTNIHTKY